MKIYIKNKPITEINRESIEDYRLVDSLYLKTKIAYQVINAEPINNNFWTVNFNDNSENSFDFDKRRVRLGLKTDLEKARMLRAITDLNSLENFCLPLHAGLIQYKTTSIFLFADTKQGKSTTCYNLSQEKGIHLIGDDHIVLGNGFALGNGVLRIRNNDGVDGMGENYR